MNTHEGPPRPEPRWPSMCAMLALAGLRLLLPSDLSWGPDWAMAVAIPGLMIPAYAAHRARNVRLNELFGYTLLAVVTLDMAWSMGLLISRLPAHRDTPNQLLKAAAGLWVSNILVFASWYWRLDAGGPNQRHARGHHRAGAFLFPQMTMETHTHWKPAFIDYLFLAFNTSTAFSPTDVPVLSRWAKLLMMIQSLISLTTIALLAARAVNIL